MEIHFFPMWCFYVAQNASRNASLSRTIVYPIDKIFASVRLLKKGRQLINMFIKCMGSYLFPSLYVILFIQDPSVVQDNLSALISSTQSSALRKIIKWLTKDYVVYLIRKFSVIDLNKVCIMTHCIIVVLCEIFVLV